MNLETVEERCLAYLRQAKNPLVPLARLAAYCRHEAPLGDVTEQTLLDFLRPHDQVLVLEGPAAGEEVGADTFSAAGILMGPRVILRSRVPSREEMSEMMIAQLDDMEQALQSALKQAEENPETTQAGQVREAVERVDALRKKLGTLFS